MAILIPSKNVYSVQNKKILNNKIRGVEIGVNEIKFNKGFKEYNNEATDVPSGEGLYSPTTENDKKELTLGNKENQFKKEYEPYTAYGNTIYTTEVYQKWTFKIKFDFPFGDFSNGILQEKIEKLKKRFRLVVDIGSGYYYSSTDTTDDWTPRGKPKYDLIDGTYALVLTDREIDNDFVQSYVYSEKDPTVFLQSNAYINFKEITEEHIIFDVLYIIGSKKSRSDGGLSVRGINNHTPYIYLDGFSFEKNEEVLSNGKNNFSLSGNELTQKDNVYNGNDFYNELTSNVISSYKNGKETATIRCDIGEYYNYESYTKNENGTINVTKGDLVISTKKESIGNMYFKIGDEVIPMARTGDGTDKFMSVKKDGSPKSFIVIGTKIYFDGAIYQELTLQEKTA